MSPTVLIAFQLHWKLCIHYMANFAKQVDNSVLDTLLDFVNSTLLAQIYNEQLELSILAEYTWALKIAVQMIRICISLNLIDINNNAVSQIFHGILLRKCMYNNININMYRCPSICKRVIKTNKTSHLCNEKI